MCGVASRPFFVFSRWQEPNTNTKHSCGGLSRPAATIIYSMPTSNFRPTRHVLRSHLKHKSISGWVKVLDLSPHREKQDFPAAWGDKRPEPNAAAYPTRRKPPENTQRTAQAPVSDPPFQVRPRPCSFSARAPAAVHVCLEETKTDGRPSRLALIGLLHLDDAVLVELLLAPRLCCPERPLVDGVLLVGLVRAQLVVEQLEGPAGGHQKSAR